MSAAVAPPDRIALALDLPLEEGVALYRRVAPYVGAAKVGLSLFVEHGPRAVKAFQELGARVFLDLKLHDIPNTVELAARQAGALGVQWLTVHASGGEAMLRAALKGAQEGAAHAGHPAPRILAVTVLTSLSDTDVTALGFEGTAQTVAQGLAALAQKAGVAGLVCSPHELASLRAAGGPSLYLCSPGIRPAGSESGDQARAATPSAALKAGADLLVVGRPIHAAAVPEEAARKLLAELSGS